MSELRRIVIVGAGAQAKYACEIFTQQNTKYEIFILGREGAGRPDWCSAYAAEFHEGFGLLGKLAKERHAPEAIVCMADAAQKRQLCDEIQSVGFALQSAIHPHACIASTASLGEGVIVNAGAIVQPFAEIGRGVMIHANVTVEHDCKVGDFANLAPGVSLAGWVQVGAGAQIFTGSSVIPTKKIGEQAIVGAGATVIEDVADGAQVVGTPARPIS